MAEFSGRLGPHVVVRERGLTVMLVSRTGSSRMFWVQEDALQRLRQQYPNGQVCFTIMHGRDVIELPASMLPRSRRRGTGLSSFLGFHIDDLRAATQQQLKLV